jgi:hypothetical protein
VARGDARSPGTAEVESHGLFRIESRWRDSLACGLDPDFVSIEPLATRRETQPALVLKGTTHSPSSTEGSRFFPLSHDRPEGGAAKRDALRGWYIEEPLHGRA